MPINAANQRVFHRTLFAGMLQTVILLKREDDQREGTVTAYKLFDVWRGQIYKTGQPIQGEMSSDHRATWHVPRVELDRVGVHYINALDRIVDKNGWYWQPESTTNIVTKLILVHLDIDCLRVDPPRGS
jgi:hypothetical protein